MEHCLPQVLFTKMVENTLLTVESIKKEAQSCSIQWNEIANDVVGEWFSTVAKAKGTCREFILVSVLPTVSALMGNTTVKIFDRYEERVNLYMLGLGGPSTGTTQSHRTCIIEPILNYLEGKTGGTKLLLVEWIVQVFYEVHRPCCNKCH